MAVNVKVIHPTNNSDVDIGVPEETLLRDVFAQLIEESFLSSGQQYSGSLRLPNFQSRFLDNEKSISENGVENNSTILTLISTSTHDCMLCQLSYNLESFNTLHFENPIIEWNGDNECHTIVDWDCIQKVAALCKAYLSTMDYRIEMCYGIGCSEENIKLTLQKQWWKNTELAVALGKNDETAKNLLCILGYQFHELLGIYSKTEETDRIAAQMQR